MSTSHPAARMRGLATGLLTAALAVAAHGVGSGAIPGGAAAALLAVLAATIGALAATTARAGKSVVLVGLLDAGQLVGHLLLSAAGHQHTLSTSPPAAVMLAAHVVAIAAGAVLIAAGDRLCGALSRAVRAMVRAVWPVAGTPIVSVRRAEQPLRSALLLAASVSHRGPPVSLAR